MQTAVILNIRQARILAEEKKQVAEVISFCPTATYFLREHGYNVTSTSTIYGTCSHARVVVAADNDMKKIARVATEQYALDALQSESIATLIHNHLLCVYHLHYSLRGFRGRSLIWADGKRTASGTYEEMFANLAHQVGRDIIAYAKRSYSYPNYLLAAVCNAIIYALVKNGKRLKAMDYGDELPKRVFRAMTENGDNPMVFNARAIGKNSYKTTSFFIKSLVRIFSKTNIYKPVYVFRITAPARYRDKIAPLAMPALTAPGIARAVQDMLDLIVPFVRAETEMGKRIVQGIRPQLAVSEHAIYPHVQGGLFELQALGGKHAMINHGTHTLQHDPMSVLATLSWGAQQHLITPYTTHALPKSPLTEALYPAVREDRNYRILRTGIYGTIENKASKDGKFVILQAGNYTDPFHHVPWCKETADEYLLAIFELLEEVGKLDNVELIIKLKNKKSATHKTIVENYIKKLGIEDKARVDTTSKFSDVISRAHIVVCNLSGTIEETLANHIPLMIHTHRKNYFHIDRQAVAASTIDGLSPAYLVQERADIGRIITALDKRRGELNNPALFAKVAWQEKDLTSIHDIAKILVQSAKETHVR